MLLFDLVSHAYWLGLAEQSIRGKIRIFLLVEDLSEVYKSSEAYAKRPIEGSNKVTSSSISISISGVTSHFF